MKISKTKSTVLECYDCNCSGFRSISTVGIRFTSLFPCILIDKKNEYEMNLKYFASKNSF